MADREQLVRALRRASEAADAGDESAAADARRLAQALQQMGTGRQAAPQQPEEGQRGVLDQVGDAYRSYGDTMRSGAQTGLRAGQLAAEGASQGIMELIQAPGAVLNQAPRLANLIPGVEGVGPIVDDYSESNQALFERLGLTGVTQPENRLEEYVLEGGRAGGGAAAGAGALSLGMRGAQGTSALGQVGRSITDTFARRPGTFLAADMAGGAGAAAGGDGGGALAESLGFGETGQEVGRGAGSLLGGFASGVAPVAAPAAGRRGADYLTQQFAPFTDRGARQRAAGQLQRQVADPSDPEAPAMIERAATRAEQAADGVTPARATQEPGLIAQENVLARESPELGRRLRGQTEAAQREAEAGVRGMAGTPQSRQDWSHDLINRVAAPGARVERGDTDQMLRQAYESFGPAYREFDGIPVDGSRLGQRMNTALTDDQLPIGESARRSARAIVGDQLQGLARRADGANLQSEDLFTVRQNLRGRIRDLQGRQGQTADETRTALTRAERELTDYLNEALPRDARERLRTLDNQYRQFKRIEEGAFRGGEGELDPKRVLDSIRTRASSQGAITRGDQEDLRRAVIQGLDGEDFLRDRELLSKAVRGVPPEQRKPVQAKLLNSLSDRARSAPNEQGERLLDGNRFREQINENRAALRAAGMGSSDLRRLDRISQVLVDTQRRSPEDLQTIFTDGPNSLAQLAAAIGGARAGQNLAGGGIGASLVLAQFMSNRARRLLETAFGTASTQLLNDAATDPQLYAALLRTRNASVPKQREAAATLEAWLLQNIADPGEERSLSARTEALGPEVSDEDRQGIVDFISNLTIRSPGGETAVRDALRGMGQ